MHKPYTTAAVVTVVAFQFSDIISMHFAAGTQQTMNKLREKPSSYFSPLGVYGRLFTMSHAFYRN